MKQLLNLKFKLLDSKKSRFFLVLFMFVYGVLFLYFFMPFNMRDWAPLSEGSQFFTLLQFAFVGAMGLVFSQFFIRKWLGMERFLLGQFLIWLLFELLFLTFLLTIFFGNLNSFPEFLSEFPLTLKHTFLILFIPYSIVLLILSLFRSQSELQKLKKGGSKEEMLNQYVKFTDDNGKVKYTIQLQDLLYLESTDNYVYIHYRANQMLKKELLRNSLKNLESSFIDSPIKRCHRSYMVNLLNLNMAKKMGQKHVLKLNDVDELIPVSKTYQKEFMENFESDI